MQTVKARVMNRIGTETEWLATNPVILKGEVALVIVGDFIKFKVGDGIKTFSQVTYNVFDPTNLRGRATPATNPGTPIAPELWIGETGTYPTFGGVVITGPAGFIIWDGTAWSVVNVTINLDMYATIAQIKDIKDYTDILKDILRETNLPGLIFSDEAGNICMLIREDGTLDGIACYFNVIDGEILTLTKQINIDQITIKQDLSNEFVITDEAGNIVFSSRDTSFNTFFKKAVDIIASVEIFLNDGQSNSLGINGINQFRVSLPELIKEAVKLKGYGWFEDPQSLTQLEQLTENGTFESPAFGMAKMIVQALKDENDFIPLLNDYKIAMISPGVGGTSIEGMGPGTQSWTKMLSQITAISDIVNAQGKTCKVVLEFWTQGEANISNTTADYKSKMLLRNTQLNEAVKAITGQTEDINVMFYQLSGYDDTNISTAFFELFQEYPNKFYLGCPTYQFLWGDSGSIHFANGIETRNYGVTMGYAAKRLKKDLFDWKPLYPKKFTLQKNIIDIEFNVPEGKLVLDTSIVTNPGNFGFNVVAANGTPININSVTLVRDNVVRLFLASNPSIGDKVTYAFKNGASGQNGRATGSRGCLRDQQGDRVKFMPNTINFRVDNYCVIFSHTL